MIGNMSFSHRFFSPDYAAASHRFCEHARAAGARMHRIEIAARGPNGESLGIDIAWFGAQAPKRVLVHSSGLHGVEGFAGSAIQMQFLNDAPQLPPDAAVVLVHILNPYGMVYLRRVNESNVDLNRNFRNPGSYSGAPPLYFNSFLNPASAPSFDFFRARAAFLVARHGMAALKQSIAGGQCDFPRGLFFGGSKLEEGPARYTTFLQEMLVTAEQAIFIDVHTGLGKFGDDLLLVEYEDLDQLRRTFGERVTAMQPQDSSAYRIEGGIESMLFRLFPKRRPVFIGQEFGTYGGLKVLHALREENRWHHFGNATLDHYTKKNIKEAFCPNSERWRSAVLSRGRELLQQATCLLSRQ